MATTETRDGVTLTNLDEPLFAGAEATKRGLVDYLDAIHRPMIDALPHVDLHVVHGVGHLVWPDHGRRILASA